MNWSEFITELLEHDLKFSSTEVEEKTGIRYQVIDRWKRGEVGKPQRNTIRRLENGLNIKIDDHDPKNITYEFAGNGDSGTVSTIYERHEPFGIKGKTGYTKANANPFQGAMEVYQYPVLGEVYAGEPDLIDSQFSDGREAFTYNKAGHNCFALRVNGRSMETTLRDGDIVLVDMSLTPVDGDLVAVKLKNGSQYIKRFRNLNYAFVQLSSDNSEYGVKLVDKNDVEVIYPVVQITFNLRNAERRS